MTKSKEKYYDPDNYYPNAEYPRNDGSKTKLFHIRLTQDEINTWKELKFSKRVHSILKGEEYIDLDSKKLLKDLYNIMNDYMTPKDKLTPELMTKLLEIEEILNV